MTRVSNFWSRFCYWERRGAVISRMKGWAGHIRRVSLHCQGLLHVAALCWSSWTMWKAFLSSGISLFPLFYPQSFKTKFDTHILYDNVDYRCVMHAFPNNHFREWSLYGMQYAGFAIFIWGGGVGLHAVPTISLVLNGHFVLFPNFQLKFFKNKIFIFLLPLDP